MCVTVARKRVADATRVPLRCSAGERERSLPSYRRNRGRVGTVTTSTSTRGGGRAQATRATLLAAARDVFAAGGFADANITDVVAKAGASVGSLYHHFGGKADLYLALFDDYQASQEQRAAEAVRTARLQGETDTLQ